MLSIKLLLVITGLLLTLDKLTSTNDDSSNCSKCKEAGRLTYENFMKAHNDEEMRRFLIANYQDPKDFEGMSRLYICNKMKEKAENTGTVYNRKPF